MLPEPTLPATDSAARADSPIDATAGAAAQRGHALPIAFTGSGSEYFRIWIVNLLLTIVTLGLYHPWAKVRRLRYFYGNTVVGEHALDFHGDPLRMLRGFLLVGALVLLYSLAGQVSPLAGLLAFAIVAAVWPALFRASMQFRMANTSWRGLRFRFTGDMAGAYRAMLPLFVPGLIVLAAVLFVDEPAAGQPSQPGAAGALIGLAALAPLLLFPLFWWLLKKYQHDHYAIGQLQTELRTGAGSFYLVFLKTFGVSLLAGLAVGAVVAVLAGASLAALFAGGARGSNFAGGVLLMFASLLAVYAAMALVIQPYATARLQNLVWTRTKSTDVRFESVLRFWPLFGLTLKNWLLVLLTLGLYWPFAKVAVARLRLGAVTAYTRNPPDELVSSVRARADDATGDAAGDLFGIDIGL
jgi:uncharacterized membrane protein YjgN (DUF898 family)